MKFNFKGTEHGVNSVETEIESVNLLELFQTNDRNAMSWLNKNVTISTPVRTEREASYLKESCQISKQNAMIQSSTEMGNNLKSCDSQNAINNSKENGPHHTEKEASILEESC